MNSWYNIMLLQEQKKENMKVVQPIDLRNSNERFDVLLKTKRNVDFFKERKEIKVIPKKFGTTSEKLINLLIENGEISIFAELEDGDIYVSIKTKTGTVYPKILKYTDLLSFQNDFSC